jgi:hypothetical protein
MPAQPSSRDDETGRSEFPLKSEAIEFHEREAARLRLLLANATPPALKARLAGQAEKHARLTETLEHDKKTAALRDRAIADA